MNNELADECKKDWARMLYTQHDVNIKDTALQVGVSEACIRNWIGVGNWDSIKCSLRISKQAQLRNIHKLLDAHYEKMSNAAEPNAKDVDLFLKYANTIRNLEGDITIAEIVQVGSLFLNWLRRRHLDLSKTVGRYYDSFISHRSSPLNQ